MSTLRLKPKPYVFAGEIERKQAHDVRFATAQANNPNRPICPYCYQPPMRAPHWCRCTP